jgi:hypothetical protein
LIAFGGDLATRHPRPCSGRMSRSPRRRFPADEFGICTKNALAMAVTRLQRVWCIRRRFQPMPVADACLSHPLAEFSPKLGSNRGEIVGKRSDSALDLSSKTGYNRGKLDCQCSCAAYQKGARICPSKHPYKGNRILEEEGWKTSPCCVSVPG